VQEMRVQGASLEIKRETSRCIMIYRRNSSQPVSKGGCPHNLKDHPCIRYRITCDNRDRHEVCSGPTYKHNRYNPNSDIGVHGERCVEMPRLK
jgi:hypothetical protein